MSSRGAISAVNARVRQRPLGTTSHPRADRFTAAGYHAGFVAAVATDAGFAVEERKIDVEELRKGIGR